MTSNRRQDALAARVAAAELASQRAHPEHRANGEEERYACASYALSFTKGLAHDPGTGLLAEEGDFVALRRAIDEGFIDPFTLRVPRPDVRALHPAHISPKADADAPARQWEAPTAGLAFDLEGPDAQAVTMAPAPALGSRELAYEMAEVYELALLRDVSFSEFEVPIGPGNEVEQSVQRLCGVIADPAAISGRPRTVNSTGALTPQEAFRGSSPGVADGPYVSQFLLIGTPSQNGDTGVADGKIRYGAQLIDQRVPVACEVPWMTDRDSWLAVQDGTKTRNDETLFQTGAAAARRFICTPRDLATYVHDDALYQAYLNACLILLGLNAPFDPSFAHLSGQHPLRSSNQAPRARHAGGFALYGPPHVLSLVTEVATRALKAVRFQKFNTHIRLRPEALAGRIALRADYAASQPALFARVDELARALQPTLHEVEARTGSELLDMAFQEGSPMHPSYGAGHATVAGACVTILKAFFDTNAVLRKRQNETGEEEVGFGCWQPCDQAIAFVPTPQQEDTLEERALDAPLTLEGELNKLAANISIGRNMAGVHYYSDYYDSLRMGEQIALGILEEQALTYPTDPFVLTVPTFDGPVVRIGAR